MLRSVTDKALDDKAASLDDPDAPFDEGAAYRAVLQSRRGYIARQQAYFDFEGILKLADDLDAC
jgi:hypothetical protein